MNYYQNLKIKIYRVFSIVLYYSEKNIKNKNKKFK